MKEIGGYIEFEHYNKPMLYEDGIKLNCGRNCLAYLIKARNIKKIALPLFLCETVSETCRKYDVDIDYYHINEEFHPIYEKNCDDRWVYIVNYYGQLRINEIKRYKEKYGLLILDNAQSYFDKPIKGIDTIYTCRKYFGVSDGGILYTDAGFDEELEQDVSMDRIHFLLGRFEGRASEYYQEYVDNNDFFDNEPIKRMSKLTENLLKAIDYNEVKKTRTDNYNYLCKSLLGINEIKPKAIEGAYSYPLLIRNGKEIRKKLIDMKLYVPKLWPNVAQSVSENDIEYLLAEYLLPLPCDQRYSLREMDHIANVIKELSGKK